MLLRGTGLGGDVFEKGALAILGEGRQEFRPALGMAQKVLEGGVKRPTGKNDQVLQ